MTLSAHAALAKDKRNVNRDCMQHRHYALLAGVLNAMPSTFTTKQEVADYIAEELSGTQSNFNRKRFLAACGVEE